MNILNVTHNSAEVVLVYSSSISTLEEYTARATIFPQNSTNPVQMLVQEIPFPPVSASGNQLLIFSFTGLEAVTAYVFDVRILSACIVIGRAESGSFTTESVPPPADSESGLLLTLLNYVLFSCRQIIRRTFQVYVTVI